MATRSRKIGMEGGEAGAAFRFPLMDPSVARLMGWPVEVWLRCQAGILKATEPAASGWIGRRREAATAALDTFEKLAGCSDLQEAASIHRFWFEESMKRLDSDLHALADQAMALSHEALAATRYAAQTSSEVVALAIQPAQRAGEEAAEAAE